MTRFRFSLEPVLLQRRARETQLAAEAGRARRRLDAAKERLRAIETEFARAPAVFDRMALAARAEIARCAGEFHTAAVALETASAERKAIEMLKDRRLAEFASAAARKEERELDEANHR